MKYSAIVGFFCLFVCLFFFLVLLGFELKASSSLGR
jgi:hypothetical protein